MEYLIYLYFCIIFTISFILYTFIKILPETKALLKIQGPKRHFLFGNIPDLTCTREEINAKFRLWAKEYYPVYSLIAIPKSFVNVIGPDDIEILLSTTKHSTKSDLYFFMSRWLREGLIFSNGIKNQQRRKLLTPSFHFHILENFIETFIQQTDELLEDLDKAVGEEPIDLVPFLTTFALKAINETSMGIKLDFNRKDHREYHNNVVEMGNVLTHRFIRPWLYHQWSYYNLTPTGRKENRLIKKLHNFTEKIVQERIDNMFKEGLNYKKEKMAMLDLLISAKDKNLIDFDGICEEVDTFMLAGHDSVSLAACYTLMELANHRNYQDLVIEEINRVFSEDTKINYNKLMELQFLEMCIKETLRLFPIVQFISRITDCDVKTTSGYTIPKGTNVNIHIFDLHRIPHIYPNPEKFDPYRFRPENVKGRHKFAYLPFSAGPRNCMGQKYALLEIKTVLVGILRKYVLEPVDSADSVCLYLDLVLRSKNGVKIKLVRRK